MNEKIEHLRLPYPVPYYCQIASPELVNSFFTDGVDPILDPRWEETGAATPQEYAYWVERACGIVCVKMCVEAFNGPIHNQMEWIKKGLAVEGYLITKNEEGVEQEIGWVHSRLALLIQNEGFFAAPAKASVTGIYDVLNQGKLVIASVSYELGTPFPITRKGGHLVVIVGVDSKNNVPQKFIIHNPSGRKTELQANASIPVERFEAAFSGRVVIASRNE
jgi:hypothetical protein